MTEASLSDFVEFVRYAPCRPVSEWINQHATNKKALWMHSIDGHNAGPPPDRKFDVIVCDRAVERTSNVGLLLEQISPLLEDKGKLLIRGRNPFAAAEFFRVLFDGWNSTDYERLNCLSPQAVFQVAKETGFYVIDFCWLNPDGSSRVKRPFWGVPSSLLTRRIVNRRRIMQQQFGIILQRKVVPQRNRKRPFVTVVLPTCNRAHDVREAVISLFGQDYPPDLYEIIVVDNGSTDNTPDVVAQMMKENKTGRALRYVREPRKGLVFARHTGAYFAEGEILIFTDDDALFDENWVSAIVDVYEQYPGAGAVGTKIEVQWDREPPPWVRSYEYVLAQLDYGDQVIVRQGLSIYGGSFSIKKDILKSVNGFNPGQRGPYIVGDSESGLCRKLEIAGVPVGWTPAATMYHLQKVDTNGSLSDLKRRFANNGISDAYYDTFYGFTIPQIIKDARHKLYVFLRMFLRAARRMDRAALSHDIPLHGKQVAFFLKFLWLYRYSKTIRSEIERKDWQFNDAYEPPSIP